MFALQYNNEFLDIVDPEAVVTRWVSTAFNDPDKLLGSGSELSFELADTDANAARLGFANQLANRLARKDIEVTIWLFDMPWKRCLFSFNLKDGKISGHTRIDNAEFSDVIKEKTLPQVFIKTLDGAFLDHDWIFVGSTADDTVAAIVDSLTPGVAPYAFYPHINTDIFGEYSGPDGEQQWTQPRVINRWQSGGFLIGSTVPEEIKSHWYSPSLYLTWVIKKVCTFLGYEAVGDFFEDPDIISLVIDNNSVYNMTDVFAETGWKIAPARHLPDLKITEFFKKIREEWRVIYYFDSDTRQAHFALSETVLNSPERIDLEGCIEKGRPTTTKTNETGFELVQGIDEDDELFKILPYIKSYFIGGDRVQKKIEVPVATCFMRREVNADHLALGTWRLPIKKQLGNAYSDKALDSAAHNPVDYGRNKFAFKILSYRGMMADSLGNAYPYATSDGLAPDGVTEICKSLWLGGTNGILENYQRHWSTFLIRTELTELRALLTKEILSRLSPIRKIRFPSAEGIYLEALMSEVKIRGGKDFKIRTDLHVYPNYNVSGADESINMNFLSGETVNENLIYVKIVETESDRAWRRPFLGARTLYWISTNFTAQFYSDLDGTVPFSVNGLTLNITIEHNIDGRFAADTKQYTCFGETFQFITDYITYYHKGSTTNTHKVILAEGPGYFKIS